MSCIKLIGPRQHQGVGEKVRDHAGIFKKTGRRARKWILMIDGIEMGRWDSVEAARAFVDEDEDREVVILKNGEVGFQKAGDK